jgi:anti-anti-sigma regulatory factor
MSFHFVSHPWHVQEMDDGTLVKVSAQDLDESTIAILVDDLFDLSMAEGRPNLYLDFQEVRHFPNNLTRQLDALDEKLRDVGGRLVLQNLHPSISGSLQHSRLAELLLTSSPQT